MKNGANSSFLVNLKKFYHSCPLFVIKTYLFVYSIWRVLRSLWLPVQHFTGKVHECGDTLNLCYMGWDRRIISYWLDVIFDHYERLPNKKIISTRKVDKYLNDNTQKGDLAFVELGMKPSKNNFCKSTGFILPRWIKTYMDVEFSLTPTKKVRQIVSRINRNSLELEIGSSCEDFVCFYEKMYKPYVEYRHKGSAVVEDLKKMREGFNKEDSTIYFITKDGERIAGMYEQNIDGTPFMHGIGILDGSTEILKMGTIGALYYFALDQHRKNGIKRVNIGGSSPMIKDGLTNFKLTFGAKISEISNQISMRLKMIPLGNSTVAKDFFIANPFVFLEDENMYCALFKNEEQEEEAELKFQKRYHKANAIGVKKARVFCFNALNEMTECFPNINTE